MQADDHRNAGSPCSHVPAAALAIDGGKNSYMVVKWVVDHLAAAGSTIVVLHVANHHSLNHGFAMTGMTQAALEEEMKELFHPYKGFCARKGVQLSEVVLEATDVPKAIIEYVTAKQIQSVVLGASTRNAIVKKFKSPDVPTCLLKGAPDFCNVYVIAKGKPVHVRLAKCGVPASRHAAEDGGSVRGGGGGHFARRASRALLPAAAPDRRSIDSWPAHELSVRTASRDLPLPTPAKAVNGTANGEGSHRSSRRCISLAHDLDFASNTSFSSVEDFADPSAAPSLPVAGSQRELEAEMRRLRLELKQTMDMYNAACKEAITAKKKAKELQQLKLEEARRFEDVRQAEEAARALAESEKAKCKVAMEAAEAARRVTELEAQKRHHAEVRAKREAEERVRALDAMAHQDNRYRKYHIDDIELATERFSESLKIGEGGYGPVYRASLDHTPVAIKVLRPDAHQGRKQFQQEVEVLSCIRHPNMVLLLGACPEYGCLVYEYMDNGSLEDRLIRRGGTPPIPWSVRFKIAAEIATALLFLHQAKPEPLVHRDLKPGNVLLDRNYVSKISDVGLARLVPPAVADSVTRYRLTSTAGTLWYIDPEYQQTGMLGVKSDIYSLGVTLLQIVTARPPMALTLHVEKAIEDGTFADMLDPTVPDWPVDEALRFARLALKCTELSRKDRPDLATVVLPELNRLRNLGHAYDAGIRHD